MLARDKARTAAAECRQGAHGSTATAFSVPSSFHLNLWLGVIWLRGYKVTNSRHSLSTRSA
jgi:hypothetical protein